MLYTSFAKLREAGVSPTRYKFLAKGLGGIRHYGQATPIPIDRLLEINGLDDALWALRALIEPSDKEIRLLACEFADHVLPLFETKYPDDKRPRHAIETARRFADGLATQHEFNTAWAAAWGAVASAGNAWAAGAARDAGEAACAATGAAASDAGEAAGAAGAAARDAAWATEQDWQTGKLKEMLKGEENETANVW